MLTCRACDVVGGSAGEDSRWRSLIIAARRGASVFNMGEVSRHKPMDFPQAYVRNADLFQDHAGHRFAIRRLTIHIVAGAPIRSVPCSDSDYSGNFFQKRTLL